MSVAAADLHAWLASRRQRIDAALERRLPGPPAAPARVCDAMRYSVFAGGKRFRPILVLAAAEATGARTGLPETVAQALAVPAACAVELIHTYSLVHDDLPAMDNDTLRRGRPTAHVVFGDGLAILSGDGLLTEAFALLAREPVEVGGVSAHDLDARKLQTIRVIAEAAGSTGMVGGQAIDLQAALPGATPLDPSGLRGMHARKTGALIRGSTGAGAIMAGGSGTLLAAIDRYADHLGLAFQIVDDILDVEGVSAELGKTAGKDAAAGKPTYPALFGLDQSRRLAAESVDRALDAIASERLEGQLAAIGRWVLSRTH